MAFSFIDITGLTPCTNKLVTTKGFRSLGKQTLLEKKSLTLKGEKTMFALEVLENFLHNSLIFFLVLLKNKLI